MTHDPLCGLAQPCDEEEPEHGYCSMQHGLFCIHCHQWCICNVIAKVREDERASLTAEWMSNHGEKWEFAAGQRDMLAKCIAAVEAYAEERLTVTKKPNMSEDITAALHVAVNRLRALQEKS